MEGMNSVILEGNVTKDAEVKATPNDTKYCNITLAVNHYYKQRNGTTVEEVSFFDVLAWGKLAQACSESAKKGTGMRVVGRLKQDRWKNEEDKTRSKVILVAEHIEFLPTFGSKEMADATVTKHKETIAKMQEKEKAELAALADAAEGARRELEQPEPGF